MILSLIWTIFVIYFIIHSHYNSQINPQEKLGYKIWGISSYMYPLVFTFPASNVYLDIINLYIKDQLLFING